MYMKHCMASAIIVYMHKVLKMPWSCRITKNEVLQRVNEK
ncbi:unnamed protein product [Acanthoscelides obtectus]|uniref:Uncharacterized protein n=1 Tax=Acanthoscelides obtectus TaxID=200917 RepID=A0A9P0PFR9_ACAOB|nr:unnamed protein product [Acanthoscelides obtectus]CAK1641198.1 hypothetical protein AOBTE_LOCUS12231 [Acanthoscelides obtectus]